MKKPPAFTHIRSEEERLWDEIRENAELRKKIRILRTALRKIRDKARCAGIARGAALKDCCHCIASEAINKTGDE
jgi:hypothetical protein